MGAYIFLNFCICCEVELQFFFFFMWLSSCQSSICWRDYSFLIEWLWHSCCKSTDHRLWVYIWTLIINFIGLYMCSLMPVPHYLDCCSFVVSFENKKCESSYCVIFQDGFGYLGPLPISCEFKNHLSISVTKTAGI